MGKPESFKAKLLAEGKSLQKQKIILELNPIVHVCIPQPYEKKGFQIFYYHRIIHNFLIK